MNKSEFLEQLESGLKDLPNSEIKKSLNYYSEMIDDRIEDGESESDAVASLGSVDEIAVSVKSQTQLSTQTKRKSGYKILIIILLVLGSPIWLSIFLALFSIILAVYVTAASIIISLFSVVLSFLLGGTAAVFGSPIIMYSNIQTGIFCIGAGLILFGLGVFLAYGTVKLLSLIIKFTAFCGCKLKSLIIKKKSA